MRSYKLHAAIVTIACIALQEVKCARDQDEYIESSEVSVEAAGPAAVYPEQDCGEFRSQIWDEALSNPKTMQLAKAVLKSAEDMATDPVCSDTSRAVMNFAHVMGTNENAHYVAGMFFKLAKTAMKQATLDESGQAGETRQLFYRVVDSPEIRDLVARSLARPAELLKDPANRERMVKMARSLFKMFKPSEEEKMVKQTVNKVKGAIVNPLKASKSAIRKLGGFLG